MNKFEVYIPPSRDTTLLDFAKTLNLKYWYNLILN
jgi:hypothetical protein